MVGVFEHVATSCKLGDNFIGNILGVFRDNFEVLWMGLTCTVDQTKDFYVNSWQLCNRNYVLLGAGIMISIGVTYGNILEG